MGTIALRRALSPHEFRERRQQLGLTQRQLARELGVTETTVARWERGERVMANGIMVRLALDHIGHRRTDVRATTIPGPPTPLVGRSTELALITQMIRDEGTRILTLVGPGGVGKTTLALAAGRTLASSRVRGGCLIELADLPPGSPVDAVVARSLGVREVAGHPLSETLARALKASDVLLLLDNCEHVAESVATLIGMLVRQCPSTTVVATTRTALRVRAERRLAVGPLAVPDLARVQRPASLLRVPAVALFVERWSAIHSDFRLTARDAPVVAEICVRLDGLPLALELAASAGGVGTPTELLKRLVTTLQSVDGDAPRDVPERHRGLRAVLDWSYRLLDPQDQAVFRRLAVFAGEFDRGCAAYVTASDTADVATSNRTLDRLADASLLITAGTTRSGSRLRLFETVRWYAREKIDDQEFATAARRLAQWLLDWAESGATNFYGAGQASWLHEVEAEFGNVRTALAWSGSPGGDAELGLRLAAAVRRYWDMRGLLSEAETTLGTLLDAAPEPTQVRLQALIELAGLATRREDVSAMERFALEAVEIAEQIQDLWGLSDALESLTYAAFLRRDPAAAGFAERALDCAVRSGHRVAIGQAYLASGVAAFGVGRFDAAVGHVTRALDAARSRGDCWLVGESADVLALVHLTRRDFDAARAMGVESLTARIQLQNLATIPMSLRTIGIADTELGQPGRATILFGYAEFVEEASGVIPNTQASDAYRHALGVAEESLGPARFQQLWDDGRDALEADIVALAGGMSVQGPPMLGPVTPVLGPVTPADPDRLSRREREVAGLIAQGLTSAAIARRLGVARRTVESHTEHVMIKLGVHSRSLVAVWVAAQRMKPDSG